MRIGNMIRQLLAEAKSAPLDDASRQRLRAIYQTSISELKQGLAPELADELERLTLPFSDDATPSDAELRIAQAQLVGWLEALFHGIQTALFAQQMAARAQLSRCGGGYRPHGATAAARKSPRGQRWDVSLEGRWRIPTKPASDVALAAAPRITALHSGRARRRLIPAFRQATQSVSDRSVRVPISSGQSRGTVARG